MQAQMERIRRSYLYKDRYQAFLSTEIFKIITVIYEERECSYDTENKDEIDLNNGHFVTLQKHKII